VVLERLHRILYQNKLSDVVEEVDDIPFLIHRTKYTHTHISPPSNETLPEKSGVFIQTSSSSTLEKTYPQQPLSPTNHQSTSQNKDVANLYRIVEQHQKRIELLEEEIEVLVKHYTSST
jgi:hypothetical protein